MGGWDCETVEVSLIHVVQSRSSIALHFCVDLNGDFKAYSLGNTADATSRG